jgi:hypothetical protein
MAEMTKKYEKEVKNLREVKTKLKEYYEKVVHMKKEQKKVTSIIHQCCPDAEADLKDDAGIVTRVASFAKVHRELVEVSEAEAQVVADMEDRVNALQEQKKEVASNLAVEHTELRISYDKVVSELKRVSARCEEMSKNLAKRDEAAKRTKKENDARITFLEKENLDLMKQAKKTQKENKKLAKALQNSADRPRDKENTGVNAVVESIPARGNSAAKVQSTRSSSRIAAAEAAAGSGHTMSETNELALMQELMDDDEALLGEDNECVDDLEEDAEPECATQ